MSVDDLHAFFTKLESDESLRQEVIALDALGDTKEIVSPTRIARSEMAMLDPPDVCAGNQQKATITLAQ